MGIYFRLFLIALRGVRRTRRDLVLENLALRRQLMVYERSRRPTELTVADRRFWATLARRWTCWRESLVVVQPATVVRWHRTAWRRYWTWRSRPHRGGRPRVTAETRPLSSGWRARIRPGARCALWANSRRWASRSAP